MKGSVGACMIPVGGTYSRAIRASNSMAPGRTTKKIKILDAILLNAEATLRYGYLALA